MNRKEIFLKNLRTIFLSLLAFLMTIEILIPSFGRDLSDIFIVEEKARSTFRTDLYVSSAYTEIICTLGLFAHFKNSYRMIRVFNLFEGINCIFSLYITIRVLALSVITILNLTLLYVGSKYEQNMKQELQQITESQRHVRIRNQIQTISRNNLPNNRSMGSVYSDPSPDYEPPPPYSLEMTEMAKD